MNNLKNKATWSEGDSSGGRRLLIEEFNLNFNSRKNFIRNIRNFVRSIQFDNSSSFSISDCSNSIIILNPVITNDSKDFKSTSTPLNHLKLFRTHNSILIISSSSSNLSLNDCLNPTKHPTRQDDHKILLNNFFCSDCHNLLMIFEKKPNQMRIHNSNDLTCLIRSIESDQDSLRNRTADRSIVIENSGSIRIYSPPLQSNSEDSLENRNLKDDLMNNDGRSQGFLKDLMVYDFNNFSNLIREGMFKENVSRNKLTDVSPQGKQDTGIDQIGMKNYEMLGEDKRLELVQRFEPILGFLNGKEFKSCYSSQDNLTTEIPPSDGCGDEGVLIIPDHIISMLNDPSLFSI
ncbi:hypothetical protein BY996DRAFT_6493046 [Phakopsora pachyrhizi]|nr:hypothetical protein BY996DRAFT_6493046 [Phakopsora pachyrhizi]